MGIHQAVAMGNFLAVDSLVVMGILQAVVAGIPPKSVQGGKNLELSWVLGMDW